jgi:hypothetical protein
MRTNNQIIQEIIQLTTEIETKYPELYKNMEETPTSVDDYAENNICTADLLKYLETLKSQIQHHIDTHNNLV